MPEPTGRTRYRVQRGVSATMLVLQLEYRNEDFHSSPGRTMWVDATVEDLTTAASPTAHLSKHEDAVSTGNEGTGYVLVRLKRPEDYEDVHPELVLADANINPAFQPELVRAPGAKGADAAGVTDGLRMFGPLLDGVPAFDATKPCLLTTADPTRTYCERCKNPHHACDHASGVPVVPATVADVLRQAREVLDNVRGNINPERGYAEELEADVEKAIAAIDASGVAMPDSSALIDAAFKHSDLYEGREIPANETRAAINNAFFAGATFATRGVKASEHQPKPKGTP